LLPKISSIVKMLHHVLNFRVSLFRILACILLARSGVLRFFDHLDIENLYVQNRLPLDL